MIFFLHVKYIKFSLITIIVAKQSLQARYKAIMFRSKSVKWLKLFPQTNGTVARTFRLTELMPVQQRIIKIVNIAKPCINTNYTDNVCIVSYQLMLLYTQDCRRCRHVYGVNKVATGANFAKCPPNLYAFSIRVLQERKRKRARGRQTDRLTES